MRPPRRVYDKAGVPQAFRQTPRKLGLSSTNRIRIIASHNRKNSAWVADCRLNGEIGERSEITMHLQLGFLSGWRDMIFRCGT